MAHRIWDRPRATQPQTALTVKMTSMTATADFDDFAQLNDLAFCDIRTDDLIAGMIQGIYETRPGQDISLNFVLDTPKTLADNRINLKGLASILSDQVKMN